MKNIFKGLGLLTTILLLVGGFSVNVPLVHAATTTVTDYAGLASAYTAAADGDTIVLGASIVLTSPLSISKSITIDGSASKFTLSGNTITITAGAVTLENMVLTGTENVQPESNYGIMVQGGSLTADNISLTVATNNANGNNGFNVGSGASLDLKNSTITVSDAGGNQQQYAVYSNGATAITFDTNTFSFNAINSSGSYSYLIGMQGALASGYPTITLTGTNTNSAYTKLLLVGADTLAHKQAYALPYTVAGERLGLIDTVDAADGFYLRTANSFAVKTEAQLLAALAGADTTITLANSISLASPLTISRTVIIDGSASKFTLSGNHITTSGAVTLKNMVLTGTANYQSGDGNYGIWVASGTLIADNIDMTVVTSVVAPGTTDNDGFNVASGASLDLKNSTITLTDAGALDNQHGVYAQSGAVAVTLTNNTFTFPVRTSSPYSYFISTQGATVANYPNITLTGTNTQNAYIKLLAVGADTLVHKEIYAAVGNRVAIGERLGVIGAGQGIYVRPSTGWETPITATAIAGVTVPVTGATPVTTVTAGTGYTGTVTWSGSPSTFASGTVYTATITLSATSGYTLTGVTENQFTIDGATSATNSVNSGVITAVFPATASVNNGGGGGNPPSVTPPVLGDHPEGCSGGNLFNTSTGKACINNAVPQGCSGGNLFNTSTGVACVNNAGNQNQNNGNENQNSSIHSGPYNFGNTTLKNGSRGVAVMELQRFLNAKLNLGLVVDGKLGPKTIAVIKKWQKDNGLVADGLIGAKTKAKMNASVQ